MDVQQDSVQSRFFIRLPEGEAELLYKEAPEGVLDLLHVEAPEAARGRGVADRLVRGAIEYAEAHRLKLRPTCPYVRRWLVRHPEARGVFVR